MINIVLLGPPGAGKGTQSAILQKELNLQKISTGDLIREEIEGNTALGQYLKNSVSQGLIVADDIIMDIVRKKISANAQGYIFDGIPRTFSQAQLLDNILSQMNRKIDIVIEIKVDKDKLIKRIIGRYNCGDCNQLYSEEIRPKVEGICDQCGSTKTIRRSDDNEEIFRKRFDIYQEHIIPLIKYYSQSKNIVSIDGLRDIKDISREIKELLQFKKE